jgi:putative membrane protein
MTITAQDRTRIATAIHAAEQGASAEIVCVLARSSSQYAAAPVLLSALVALVAPWLLVLLTQWSVQKILAAQAVVFVAATLAFSWMPVRMALVPRRIKRLRAHRAAIEQFHARGLARLEDRAGVLIFVSLAERYTRIVPDEHLATKIRPQEWQAAIDALTAHMKDGRIADGFVAAVERCGAILAQHVPPGTSDKRLPDGIYVM